MLFGIISAMAWQYDPSQRLSAFESGKINSSRTLIFIGGLGDGLNAVPYIQPLSKALEEINFSLTQILLTSSYTGFGFSSIDQDAKEIQKLLSYLRKIGKISFVLLGHSTGCQDIVNYFNILGRGEYSSDEDPFEGIIGIILQAPVSDREGILDMLGEEKFKKSLQIAQKLVDAGQGSHPIPVEISDILTSQKGGITAKRWLSLTRSAEDYPMGEDFFSSDLSDSIINSKLSPVAQKKVFAMVLMSEKDDAVPQTVDKNLLLHRFINALTLSPDPHLKPICQKWSTVFPGAGHEANEVKEELSARVVSFIKSIIVERI